MTGLDEVLAAPHDLPGWFGKLPGMGDFAHRRLSESFREPWDRWLQHGLMQMRLRHDDWAAHYLQGPVWFFVLAPGLAGEAAWVGLVMPSVDGVGRYFPMTVVAQARAGIAALGGGAQAALAGWWRAASGAALEGLDQDHDAGRFDAALAQHFQGATTHAQDEASADAAPVAWPGAGQSLWQTRFDGGGPRLLCAGLPREARFDMLFGLGGEVADAPVHAELGGDA